MRPVILIAAEEINDGIGNVYLTNRDYIAGIREAGGIAIGGADVRSAAEYADAADALIIPGGPDIHMARYRQYFKSFEEIADYSSVRDDLDFALCEEFLKKNKPILGIGRGAQVINVTLGGTLVRNIPGRLTESGKITENAGNSYAVVNGAPGGFSHRHGTHKIRLTEGSVLKKILGEETIVNSFHHQAADQLGEGLKASAYSEDGVIEAFEGESRPVIGVQWHPEHSAGDYQADPEIFRLLISLTGEK